MKCPVATAATTSRRDVRLGDIAELIRGVAYKPTDLRPSEKAGGLPLLRATNIRDGRLDTSEVQYVDPARVKNDQLLKPWDVLIAMSSGSKTAVGKLAQLNAPWQGTFGAFCGVLRPDPKYINPAYFGFVLHSPVFRERIELMAQGTNIKNLSKEHLLGHLVALPSLEEQRRIARILSTIDQARLATENLLAQARGVRRSCFQDLFAAAADWPAARLGDLARTSSGGTPRRDAISLYGGSIPWVKSGEVRDNAIVETEENITDEGLANSSAKLFPARTLIMAMYGATAAQVGILGIPAATNQAVCAIFPSDRASTAFLFFALQEARERLRAERYGGAQPNLSQQTIRNFEVPIPPADVQAQIVQVLTSVDRYIGAVSNHARALTAVFQSALSHLLADKVA